MNNLKISLKAARVNAGLSQKTAAIAIGVDPLTVSNWENGKTEPTITQAIKACELYNISIDNVKFCPENQI